MINAHARPFLKWAGGKRQLLPDLLRRVPAEFGTYYEPFLGGGALFWSLRPKRAVLSDLNLELVTTYRAIQTDVESVIERLESFSKHHGPELFDTLRREDWTKGVPFDTAARMLYLNKTCFNGLYRVNSRGQFNAPMGKYPKPPTICDADNLRACSKALQGVAICHTRFEIGIAGAGHGDLVYLDPPYLPVSMTANFVGFTAEGFGNSDHIRLAGEAARAKERGATVIVSNSNIPKLRSLYRFAGLKVETVKARRNINCKGTKRGQVMEIIAS
jgi:DNA adenine methylase